MKILSKKKVEELFDDIMMLNLIASESTKQQVMNEKPALKDLIRQQRIIIERCANAVYILKGWFGVAVANEIHKQFNDMRLKQELAKEAKNDTLDDIDKDDTMTDEQLKAMSKADANASLILIDKHRWVQLHNETANLYFIKNGKIEDVEPAGWWH